MYNKALVKKTLDELIFLRQSQTVFLRQSMILRCCRIGFIHYFCSVYVRCMKQIAFIINPISGTRSKKDLRAWITAGMDKECFEPDIMFTEHPGHATELARRFAERNYYAVVAVGGDGTVNEVGRALVHTDTALGILPVGSGNGLARHVRMSMHPKKAIAQLNRSEIISVDYGLANEHPFFCTCGTGFDAYISAKFAKAGKRGLITYIREMILSYFDYEPDTYHLSGDGIDLDIKAFVVTFANASQWGNNAYIAPRASIQDGLIDVAALSRFPAIVAPGLAMQLFIKNIDRNLFMHAMKVRELTLSREKAGVFHLDGDPVPEGKTILIRVVPDGLKLLVEKRF